MRRRFTGRGYSVLAALVFVAILSSAMVLTKYVVPDGPVAAVRSQLATVSPGTDGATSPAAAPANQSPAGKTQQCTPGYDYSVTEDSKGVPQVEAQPVCPLGESEKPKDVSNTQAAAAVSSVGGPSTQQKWGVRNDPERCEPNRAQIGTYKPKQGYTCRVRYCIRINNELKCSLASKIFGGGFEINSNDVRGSYRQEVLTEIFKDTPRDQHSDVMNQAGVSPAEQQGFNSIYKKELDALNQQIRSNESTIQGLDAYVANCQSTGGGGDVFNIGSPSCDSSALQKMEQEKRDLAAANERLKQQAQNLANSTASLEPSKNPNYIPGMQTCNEFDSRPCDQQSKPVVQSPPLPKPKPSTFPDPGPGSGGPGGAGGLPGNLMSALGNFLQGLMKGLTGAAAAPAQQCASDPNAYQQQQQQYQMQLQQYNYQLQQYNYDQQRAAAFGITPPPPPVAPTPCTPNQNQNTCPAAPPQPSGQCNGSWRPVMTQGSNGRQCTSSWQCVPSNATPPTAQMSCQPKVIDVGMSVGISYSCGNATGSTGTGPGFSTNNQTSGTSTVAVTEAPNNATAVNFALTCRNENLTARAECAVQIARPTIVLIANPRTVQAGESSRVGWVTSGMKSCEVWSPQMPGFSVANRNNTSVNGTATTSPISRDTTVVLTCETIGGAEKESYIDIFVANGTSTSAMTVSSSLSGKNDVRHGDTATITWDAGSVPAGSVVELWLVDVASGHFTALIEGDLETTGTFTWTLPTASSGACDPNSSYVCHQDLIAGRSYKIQASLWTPAGGYVDDAVTASPFKMAN